MAKENREFVWLECSSCKRRNYRTERQMKVEQKGKTSKTPAGMDNNNRLTLNKYCKFERKHTAHVETRKK